MIDIAFVLIDSLWGGVLSQGFSLLVVSFRVLGPKLLMAFMY